MKYMSLTAPKARGIRFTQQGTLLNWDSFFGLSGANDETILECRGNFYLNSDVGRYEGERWKVTSLETQNNTLQIVQAADCFAVSYRITANESSGVLNWKISLKNNDQTAHTVYTCLPRIPLQGSTYEMYSQYSGWCAENQGAWTKLNAGNLILTNSAGRSTESATPFACIRHSITGTAVAIHVVPCGDWVIKFRRIAGHRLSYTVIEAGLSDDSLQLQIAPGETIELPELVFCGFQGEVENASEPLQRYLLSRYKHTALSELVYNTWFLDFDVLELEELKRQAQAALDVGCKTFVVDAGWFGSGIDWENEVGDWNECLDRAFEGKMKDFADYVRSLGLNFGLWMEPERACAGSKVYQEHPQWFLHSDSIIYDLTQAEVVDYLAGQVTRLVKTYGLRWMKMDYNTNMLRDLTGENFFRYYLGERRFMAEIRRRNPECSFEGCASGGLRTDFNSVLTHFHGHFVSDTVHPLEILRIRENTAPRQLPSFMGSWVVAQETPFAVSTYFDHNRDARKKVLFAGDGWWDQTVDVSLDFALAVNLLGEWGISGNLNSFSPENRKKVRAAAEFYESHREFMANSICHPLTSFQPVDQYKGWVSMQYENINSGASLVFAFRLVDDAQTLIVYPKNLANDQNYSLRCDNEELYQGSGSELLSNGISITCLNRYEAHIYELIPV